MYKKTLRGLNRTERSMVLVSKRITAAWLGERAVEQRADDEAEREDRRAIGADRSRRAVAQVLLAEAGVPAPFVALAQANVVDDEVVDDELLGAHPPDPFARWRGNESGRGAPRTRIDPRRKKKRGDKRERITISSGPLARQEISAGERDTLVSGQIVPERYTSVTSRKCVALPPFFTVEASRRLEWGIYVRDPAYSTILTQQPWHGANGGCRLTGSDSLIFTQRGSV